MKNKGSYLTREEIFARLALFIATILWGSTFTVVSGTGDFFKPNFLLAMRFLPACLILCLVFIGRLKSFNLRYVKTGAFLGLIMFAGYALQTVAITQAGGLPGRSAFLTATYCVLVPFVNAAVCKQRPDKYNIFAAFLCLAGVAAISMPELLAEKAAGINRGDVLSLISAAVFAFYIVLLPRFIKDIDSVLITISQFAFAGTYALIFSLLFEDNSETVWNGTSVFVLAYLTVLCTALCVLLQAAGQKKTSPSTAALIFSLESVFGILFSAVFTGEKFTSASAAGCFCIFSSIVISETKPKIRRLIRLIIGHL